MGFRLLKKYLELRVRLHTRAKSDIYDCLVSCVVADVRYQEWLEKNKVQHAHADSEDDTEEIQKNHNKRRFGQLPCYCTRVWNQNKVKQHVY